MFVPKYQLLLLSYGMNFAPPCGGNCVDGGDVDGDVCANTQEKDDDEDDEDGDVDNNGWAHAQEKATLCQRMSSEAANITLPTTNHRAKIEKQIFKSKRAFITFFQSLFVLICDVLNFIIYRSQQQSFQEITNST